MLGRGEEQTEKRRRKLQSATYTTTKNAYTPFHPHKHVTLHKKTPPCNSQNKLELSIRFDASHHLEKRIFQPYCTKNNKCTKVQPLKCMTGTNMTKKCIITCITLHVINVAIATAPPTPHSATESQLFSYEDLRPTKVHGDKSESGNPPLSTISLTTLPDDTLFDLMRFLKTPKDYIALMQTRSDFHRYLEDETAKKEWHRAHPVYEKRWSTKRITYKEYVNSKQLFMQNEIHLSFNNELEFMAFMNDKDSQHFEKVDIDCLYNFEFSPNFLLKVSQLQSLHALAVDRCRLQKSWENFAYLTKIEKFSFRYEHTNSKTQQETEAIYLRKISPNLYDFEFSQNLLAEISRFLFYALDLNQCALRKYWKKIPLLKNIKSFSFRYGDMNDDSWNLLTKIIKRMPNLSALNISNNRMNRNNMIVFVQKIPKQSRITSLDISQNPLLGDDGVMIFTHSIAMPELTKLNISSTRLSADGAIFFAEQARFTPKLSCLDMSHNQIGNRGIEALVKKNRDIPNLSTLNISNNHITDANVFAEYSIPNLSKLDISANQINDTSITAIAENAHKTPRLTVLNISNNQIGDRGIEALAQNAKNIPYLTNLDISHNHMTSIGATILAQHATDLKNLSTLNTNDNPIGDDGFTAITKNMQHLTTLNASNTGISDDGIMHFVQNSKNFHSLTTIDMSFNNIGDRGASAFAQGICFMPHLSTFNLMGNNIHSKGRAALANANRAPARHSCAF